MSNIEINDEFIIEKILNPTTTDYGFNLLVKKYEKKTYFLIRKLILDHNDSNDVTQDVFIKVWKNIHKYKGDAKLFTWIYRIATNEALQFLKKKERKNFFSLNENDKQLENIIDNNSLIEGNEIELKLQKAILKLPLKQRLVFNLKYFDDLKFEDISKITNTSVGALKTSYHLAVKKINNFFTNE